MVISHTSQSAHRGVPVRKQDQLYFFLGGEDLEMQVIRDHLQRLKYGFVTHFLSWGAKVSDYKDEIERVMSRGLKPVFVELDMDMEFPHGKFVDVNHHGERFSEKASLLQVLDLIEMEPTRYDLLVAANDSGYIPAMQKMGASRREIDEIRRQDRKAQGVTESMEMEAARAVDDRFVKGDVTIVSLKFTNKCSPVTDRLFSSWKDGKENLLVGCMTLPSQDEVDRYMEGTSAEVCPATIPYEVNYFGPGDICKAVIEKFAPHSWGGGKGLGDPNGQAFAGFRTNLNNLQDDTEFVVIQNKARRLQPARAKKTSQRIE